ncbi:MAG: HRDC domain-containing protein [Proteobacteria bacterium]|nr:HRDC domain-containing protein [Pseudomonadota bacterium]
MSQPRSRVPMREARQTLDLDSPFDRLTNLACNIFGMPHAMVSLVDGEQTVFHSRIGLGYDVLPRASTISHHMIAQGPDAVTIIEDGRTDPRTRDHPMVVGAPYLRFFAGVTIVDRFNRAVGAIGVMDSRPRKALSRREVETLRMLGQMASEVFAQADSVRRQGEQLELVRLTEEMAVLESRETYDLHPDDAWKRLKMRVKKPIELAVLQKVAAWREREARGRNVPRSRILKDDTIYEIAQQQPADAEALARLRTIPKGWERSQSGAALLEAINEALAIPKTDLPRLPRQAHVPEGAAAASEMLKVLLKIVSEKEGVAAKIIANSDDLEKIAVDGEKAEVAALSGWRRELFGETALNLITGKVALRFVDKKIEAVAL